MNNETNRLYAPLMPSNIPSPVVLLDYDTLKENSSRLRYIKIKLDQDVAMNLASKTPYPAAVKVGIMKQIATTKYITLAQMRIFLGWAADRAQR